MSRKSGALIDPEPFGPVQACCGMTFTFNYYLAWNKPRLHYEGQTVIDVSCENCTKQRNTPCEQDSEYMFVKEGDAVRPRSHSYTNLRIWP